MFTTPPLAERLRGTVEGPVRFDALTRGLYSTDASIYRIEPVGVVLPRTLGDIDATMAIAREEGVPVLPGARERRSAGRRSDAHWVVDTSRYLAAGLNRWTGRPGGSGWSRGWSSTG